MANTPGIRVPNWVGRLNACRPLAIPLCVALGVAVIVVPLPTMLLDVLIAANLALATLILMTTIFVRSPLEFSVFPSLLLFTTLARLVLNIATTRLILSPEANSAAEASASAGRVIEAFASFVAGSSVVVGVIMFAILVVIQFVVITKGATRVSEVAARFTLDGMPGKQMAIDADLNAGLIDEKEARARREKIQHEADFHGAMDGASKFVRGDAIAGILITLVNLIGGFAVGMAMKGWSFGETVEVFTRLTIGDGLVSQLPAFIVSIAAGLLVTRSSSREDLNTELIGQLSRSWPALAITAGLLAVMSVTGLPMLPMLTLAGATGGVAYFGRKREKAEAARRKTQEETAAAPEPPTVEKAMVVDTLALEIGYGLVRFFDKETGDMLDRITMIRRQLAAELGFVMPPVRILDNMQFQPGDYHLKVRGNTVASAQLHPESFLALDAGLVDPNASKLQGVRTVEPAFGQPAMWIDAAQKNRAESLNYYVVDPASVLATHLTEVVKSHAAELLTREEANNLIGQLKERAPKLVEEVLAGEKPLVRPGELQRVLQNLLRERVPVRDLEAIIETLGDWATRTKDLDVLTEYVRNTLRRSICSQYAVSEVSSDDPTGAGLPVQRLYCVSLDPVLEDRIAGFIERNGEGSSLRMPPAVGNRITAAVVDELQKLIDAGKHPVVLASPQVRASVRSLLEPHLPAAAVLGYNEVSKGVEVESIGLVTLDDTPPGGNLADGTPAAQPELEGAAR
ncbi:MAG: flagellar biosynthesis protein FlhA [Planctomycetota bacterium]